MIDRRPLAGSESAGVGLWDIHQGIHGYQSCMASTKYNWPVETGMFDLEDDGPQGGRRTDYTGLKIGGLLSPIFFFFAYLNKADMGLTVMLVLGIIMIAIKIRWRLRHHVWFWATIALVLALHLPLFLMVRLPKSHVPAIAYVMPIGIADYLIILGAVGLAERLFGKGSSSSDEEE